MLAPQLHFDLPLSMRPPNPPWVAIEPNATSPSVLEFYHSAKHAYLPVRDIGRLKCIRRRLVADNKSDPNLETATFGLCSTCSMKMRSSAVQHQSPYIFFFCQWPVNGHSQRCLAGFYELGWHCPNGTQRRDYALAATRQHFVAKPIPFAVLDQRFCCDLTKPFRLFKLVPPDLASRLRDILLEQPNATSRYLREIQRLEGINFAGTGYRYVNFKRRQSYDWGIVEALRSVLGQASVLDSVSNNSPSGWWQCSGCEEFFPSGSRLALCPGCQKPTRHLPLQVIPNSP